jgi:hypothetical protein
MTKSNWLFLTLLLAAAPVTRGASTITVSVAHPGVPVSSHLYGIFLEEINHAVDGGIYAELVRNRAFNEGGANPTYWNAVGGAALSSDPTQHYGKLTRSLKTQASGGSRAGVSNGGFWGMKLSHGATYTATVWAKAADGFQGPLNLTLESADGTVPAQTTIDGVSADWRKYVRLLTVNNPQGGTADNSMVLTTTSPGTVRLQLVLLFPPTWKARANGLRTDLAGFAHGTDQAGVGRRRSQALRTGQRSASFVVPVGFPAMAPGVHESTAHESGGDADLAAQRESRSLWCGGSPGRTCWSSGVLARGRQHQRPRRIRLEQRAAQPDGGADKHVGQSDSDIKPDGAAAAGLRSLRGDDRGSLQVAIRQVLGTAFKDRQVLHPAYCSRVAGFVSPIHFSLDVIVDRRKRLSHIAGAAV